VSICGRDCNENQGRDRCADCPGRSADVGLWRGILVGIILGAIFWSLVIWALKSWLAHA
jgi:hypothetical protein